jgi:hypothetical protein
MRRLMMVVAAVAGVAVVRQWLLDRSERELGLGGDGPPERVRA